MRQGTRTAITARRDFLRDTSCGFGSLALAAVLEQQAAANLPNMTEASSALVAKPPHFPPRARRIILLFMSGGPSQVDLYDFKPRLVSGSGEPLPYKLPDTEATVGLEGTRLLGPIAGFQHHGECGLHSVAAIRTQTKYALTP